MSYDVYRIIFISGLVLSIVMFIATVLIYFLLNIKNAIGDVTGSNKRKAIDDIHKTSLSLGNNKRNRIRNSQKLSPSTKLAVESAETAKINPQDRYDNLTTPETTTLDTPSSQTTVLSDYKPEKMDMATQQPLEGNAQVGDSAFSIEIDITYVHSNEVIR